MIADFIDLLVFPAMLIWGVVCLMAPRMAIDAMRRHEWLFFESGERVSEVQVRTLGIWFVFLAGLVLVSKFFPGTIFT